ncbi:hypothetical protein MSG28_013187 [Choristoneura fumiferana]|uniref:Uncharacterized protein n=1 Tax=Choristoneura fumiferana TaxID=7141 RepID=A0ACC0KSS3_CHOFU|nr:hypothetical protein MSG28_013187 [Choristoneura fumiferana]
MEINSGFLNIPREPPRASKYIVDSRQCMLERISWCVNRLLLVEEKLENMQQNQQINDSDVDSLFSTPMYFVNWMDHTFEVLSKLALVIYRTDYKDNDELYCKWKTELLECVRELYTSLDGLLLSAMTLCKYCLSSDQIIVKTRCQVVLREAKVLLSDVIEGHTDGKFSATVDSLKLPIMPTNVNVSIDVLKDVLYVLETNTNTALLALVVYCFSNTMSPVDVLREHFNKTEGYPHQHCGDDNVEEDCDHVREFDLYGERLLQIGSFAVSCSSDQERIVSLRSGLASLEALDPHLVPALMLSPVSAHAALLTDSWRKEVQDIRDSVFLIVDPAAFAEKSKQMMQQNLKQLISKNEYDSSGVHSVIAMGCVVQDFFDVYKKNEPDALTCQDVLLPLLADLEKALLECKVVNNLLSSKDDFVYDVKKPTRTKEVSMEKLFKRLKLLYTLVNRINSLLHPEDNDDLFNSDVEEHVQNGTYTMNPMREIRGMNTARHRGCLLLVATVALAFSSYIEQVVSMPALPVPNQWPTFPRRNIAALARAGYLRGSSSFKRSISTLAKNGQLPTFRAPYDGTDKQEPDDEESHEKRNMASIARLRSYSAMKRNVQALARDGYRGGRGQYSQQTDKRNVAALARNGMIHLHKKDVANGDEYYFPFYQNPLPPLSDIDGPFDANEMYDFQQSVNPDMFPPLSQVYKRGGPMPQSEYEYSDDNGYAYPSEDYDNWYYKRGSAGLPVFGMYRPTIGDQSTRTKRYILSLPDVIDHNDIHEPDGNDVENEDKRSVDEDSDVRDNFDKRHIGSLARLGLLPSFRFSGGRYSRSGRARLLWPSQEMYRKHSPDENFGIRQYIASAEAESVDPDDADVPPPPVLAHSHPTGRLLHRPLDNDLPSSTPPLSPVEPFTKNRWQLNNKEVPKFYYFRSLKVPYHTSGKRYLLLPAVDNILLRKNYPNSSLPGRRKNQ